MCTACSLGEKKPAYQQGDSGVRESRDAEKICMRKEKRRETKEKSKRVECCQTSKSTLKLPTVQSSQIVCACHVTNQVGLDRQAFAAPKCRKLSSGSRGEGKARPALGSSRTPEGAGGHLDCQGHRACSVLGRCLVRTTPDILFFSPSTRRQNSSQLCTGSVAFEI